MEKRRKELSLTGIAQYLTYEGESYKVTETCTKGVPPSREEANICIVLHTDHAVEDGYKV